VATSFVAASFVAAGLADPGREASGTAVVLSGEGKL
jgi:hypothetical protein